MMNAAQVGSSGSSLAVSTAAALVCNHRRQVLCLPAHGCRSINHTTSAARTLHCCSAPVPVLLTLLSMCNCEISISQSSGGCKAPAALGDGMLQLFAAPGCCKHSRQHASHSCCPMRILLEAQSLLDLLSNTTNFQARHVTRQRARQQRTKAVSNPARGPMAGPTA